MRARGSLRIVSAAVIAAAACCSRGAPAAQVVPLPKGHVVFKSDFESADALAPWRGAPRLETGCRSAHALALERGADGAGVSLTLPLPAGELRGHKLLCAANVRAENVSPKPQPWNGIKLMLIIESPRGKEWPQADIPAGTFPWRRAAFSARIPADASAVTLVVGLEAVTGKARLDDIVITVAKPPAAPAPKAAAGPPFKGHELPRLRGAMIHPNIDAASLRVLGQEWNANLIRWQLINYVGAGKRLPLEKYDAWLDGELAKLDAALPHCERFGLRIALDLHSPPGGKGTASGYAGSDDGLFAERACQDKFVEVWRRMAARYRDAKPIWGFDLANEPVEGLIEEGCDDWHDLAERTAKAVRDVDPQRTLIIETAPWGGPDGFRDFEPIAVPEVVYSVHMYMPAAFTHQTLFGTGGGQKYPGEIDGTLWDKARLQAALAPVIEFQKTYGVHIYVGEFSAIRWAPGDSACRYLADLIDIFEAHGWDWSYHAFREWNGWSVEHGSDRNDDAPAAAPTDRQRLLQEWFARNKKPGA